MKFLVLGSGSIAQRHISNLLYLEHDVIVQSSYYNSKVLTINGLDVQVEKKVEFKNFDAVIIANSTIDHLKYALKAANSEIPFFIEKPLSQSLLGTHDLLRLVVSKNLPVEAGFMLHGHEHIKLLKKYLSQDMIGEVCYVRAAVGQWLPDWRPGRNYKLGYAASQKEGGGVLLDLIHEVELLQSIFGKLENKKIYKGYNQKLDLETESIASINGTFNNGAICHIEMDYIRRKYMREIEIIGDLGSIYWNYSKQQLIISYADQDDLTHELSNLEFNRNDMYLDHMRHFIARIKDPSIKPFSCLHESILALETVLEN